MIFLVFLLVSISFSNAFAQDNTVRQDVFVGGTGGYHTYRIPALAVTAKGTVLAFCEGRKDNHEDTGDIDLLLKRSEDGGRTWSAAQVVHERGGDSSITIGNPCPILDTANNRLHLLFVQDYHRLFSVYSDDEGSTWSTPREHTDILSQWDYPTVLIATGPGHGVQLSTGRLVAPVWICDRERKDRYENTTKDRIRAGMIYSDDQGETWQTGGLVPAEIAMLHENTIVERKDGSLLINMRARAAGYRAVATSTDGGLTWSDPMLDKQLPDPTVQGSMIALGGDTVLFTNPAVITTEEFHSASRKNLTLRMSPDGGQRWTHGRTIAEGPSGYSDLAIGQQGKILCLYENGEENYRAKISFISVDKDWLLKEKK